MELTELKQAWDAVETPVRSTEDIKLMLSENRHPVLKKIRRQSAIEVIGWSAFLLVYYTMLDGDQKPLGLHIALIVSVFFPLLHNLMAYRFAKHLVNGVTIKESLKNYLAKARRYAAVSVISRLCFMAGLLLFFTYGLNFNSRKYILLAVILVVYLIQLGLLVRLWGRRLHELEKLVIIFDDHSE